jgi:uncharacterized membrane protein
MVERTLEIIGGSMLILGFILATVRWFRQIFREGAEQAVKPYRQSLGRVVLIGLEVLVAATIIKTITFEPNLENIGILVAMIAIRTMLGWLMVVELSGRWPWQKILTGSAMGQSLQVSELASKETIALA